MWQFGSPLRRARVWFGCAALLLLTVAGVALASQPSDVALRIGEDPIQPVNLRAGKDLCQPFKLIPADARSARYRVLRDRGLPSVSLHGPRGRVWRLAPLRRVDGSTAETRLPADAPRDTIGSWYLCLTGAQPSGSGLIGYNGRPAVVLTGRSYSSWLDAAPTLVKRAGVGRPSILGERSLIVGLLLLLCGGTLTLILLTQAERRMPATSRRVLQVGAICLCVSSAFAVTTPAFQTPDEAAHQQYVELLNDQLKLPQSAVTTQFGPALSTYMTWSGFGEAFLRKAGRPAWTEAEEQRLDRDIPKSEGDPVPDSWSTASSQPPLYYGVVATVSKIVGGDVRDRLLVGRLLSALLMASALMAALIFARTVVPSAGGLAAVAATVIATNPLVAFLGGALNPDAAVIAAASWAMAGIAVAWRHGLTWRRALWIALAISAGLLSKLTFVGLAIPMLLAGMALLLREFRRRGTASLPSAVAAVVPVVLIGGPFYVWALLSGRGLVIVPPWAGPPAPTPDVLQWITYTFQLYVGRIPPMDDQLSGWGPDLFISGWVGTLGWLDYGPPLDTWRYFRIVAGVLVALALLGVFRALRRRRRGALADLVLWGSIAGGLMLSISWTGLGARLGGQPGFEQGRYLLPLIPIAVAGIALALRQVPSRVQRPAAVLLGVAGLAHGVLLYLMTIGRYFA